MSHTGGQFLANDDKAAIEISQNREKGAWMLLSTSRGSFKVLNRPYPNYLLIIDFFKHRRKLRKTSIRKHISIFLWKLVLEKKLLFVSTFDNLCPKVRIFTKIPKFYQKIAFLKFPPSHDFVFPRLVTWQKKQLGHWCSKSHEKWTKRHQLAQMFMS